jgi:hypothetical protein
MTQQTDRELIQHLVNELQGYRVAHPDHEMPALEAGRTRLAQPEPEGVTDEAWQEFIEQVQHAQHVASREGEAPRFDLVECALALWREAIPPSPEPAPTDEELLKTYCDARRVFYFKHAAGDSDHEDRKAAAIWGLRAALAHYTRPTIKPVPVAERLPDAEGPTASDVTELFYRHMGEGSEVGFENAIAEALARWGRPIIEITTTGDH